MYQAPADRPGQKLRELMAAKSLLLPGVFNGISALSAKNAGASALYLSGAGISNGQLGVPDIGLAALPEFVQAASTVASVTGLPVLSDADTGFGGVHNVSRAVVDLERAGLAGVHIEDQASPKRCGHLDGKTLIEANEMAAKLRAAMFARRDPSFLIIARTDARGVEGLNSATERAKRYLDAGADAIFPEGLESKADFALFRDRIHAPLLANMTEFGKTPILAFSEFREMGYEMVIFPMTVFRVMLKAMDEAYAELISTGTQGNMIHKMRTRAELYELLGYADYEVKDRDWSEG